MAQQNIVKSLCQPNTYKQTHLLMNQGRNIQKSENRVQSNGKKNDKDKKTHITIRIPK